jgi:hypothetical protein
VANSIGWKVVFACAIAGAVVGVGGCSSGPKMVSKGDVANQISAKMAAPNGQKPDSVTCPDDLKAQVGAQINCTMKVNGQTSTVNVTVSSINGDQAKFDMVNTIDKNQVASQISDQLAQQFGSKPDSVTCPDNLKGTQGATLRCQLVDSGQKYGITVTVNDVQGSDVNFGFKVDEKPST